MPVRSANPSSKRTASPLLNPSVRPLMKNLTILGVLTFLVAGCTAQPASDSRAMIGRFNYIDTSQPGCGVLAVASKATFIVEGSGQSVTIAVPCLTLQSVKNPAGEQTPIEVGDRYRIVVSHRKPTPDMNYPYLLNRSPWYLTSIEQ